MSEALSLDRKNPKTSAVSKPPVQNQNTGEIDFLDFIPIDNNAQDFDLSTILQDIEKQNKSVMKSSEPSTSAVTPQNPPNSAKTLDFEGAITLSQVIQSVTNNQSTQNHPFEPRMVFQNSSLTINYNFNNFSKNN